MRHAEQGRDEMQYKKNAAPQLLTGKSSGGLYGPWKWLLGWACVRILVQIHTHKALNSVSAV